MKKLSEETKGKLLAKAAKIQTQALVQELESEVLGYEELKTKGLDAIELNDLSEIMLIPIKYRIAKKNDSGKFCKRSRDASSYDHQI